MTCSEGNSFGWPRNNRNPALFVNTDPLLTLKKIKDCRYWLRFLSPVKVSINDHFEPPVSSRTNGLCFIALDSSSPCLHLVDKTAELWFFKVVLQVEGTADARVGDHWVEDLRTVDLFALPPVVLVARFRQIVYPLVYFLKQRRTGHWFPILDHLHCLNIWEEADKLEVEEG